MRITLYDYLASSVPSECISVLEQFDIPSTQNENELVDNLKYFVNTYGQDALDTLADIHPDRDLIVEVAELSTPYNGKSDSEYLNATGSISMERIGNIEKTLMGNSTPTIDNNNIDKTDVLLGIGVALLTATLFKRD
tara:strand:+ start:5647 stop:6057 length:411 start_codon:yes stop_codon:yes gene_type:complete